MPWVIWLLCLLHKHIGILLKCRHICHHRRSSPTAATDKVYKAWWTPTSIWNHWCLSHCLTTAQMSHPALCNGPWEPVVAEWKKIRRIITVYACAKLHIFKVSFKRWFSEQLADYKVSIKFYIIRQVTGSLDTNRTCLRCIFMLLCSTTNAIVSRRF